MLDPRNKGLDFLGDDSEKQLTIQRLHDEFSKLEEQTSELSIHPTPTNTESSMRSHKGYLQQRQLKRKKKDKSVSDSQILDEISSYLLLPSAPSTEDPLGWWKKHLDKFPKLARIARKYLAIPATSVSSERLFSDAGNLISSKRTSLDPALVSKMLFLKRNMNTMQVFAPEWNSET